MKLLGKTELTSGAAAYVELTGISTAYKDLMVVFTNQRDTSSVDGVITTLNGSTSGFAIRYFDGDGGATRTGFIGNTFTGYAQGNNVTSLFASTIFIIPNYNSTANKSITVLSAAPTTGSGGYLGFQNLYAPVTSGITSIRLAPNGASNFVQYSSFYVYGLE